MLAFSITVLQNSCELRVFPHRKDGDTAQRSSIYLCKAAGPVLSAGGWFTAHLLCVKSKRLVFSLSTKAWVLVQLWHTVEFRKL